MTVLVLFAGLVMFSRLEKTFMDTVWSRRLQAHSAKRSGVMTKFRFQDLEITAYGDGRQSRSFCYVDEVESYPAILILTILVTMFYHFGQKIGLF